MGIFSNRCHTPWSYEPRKCAEHRFRPRYKGIFRVPLNVHVRCAKSIVTYPVCCVLLVSAITTVLPCKLKTVRPRSFSPGSGTRKCFASLVRRLKALLLNDVHMITASEMIGRIQDDNKLYFRDYKLRRLMSEFLNPEPVRIDPALRQGEEVECDFRQPYHMPAVILKVHHHQHAPQQPQALQQPQVCVYLLSLTTHTELSWKCDSLRPRSGACAPPWTPTASGVASASKDYWMHCLARPPPRIHKFTETLTPLPHAPSFCRRTL